MNATTHAALVRIGTGLADRNDDSRRPHRPNGSRRWSRGASRSHTHNRWQSTTWATYGRAAIEEAAAGLDALGIEHGDRVAILSWNRPEWQEADLGTLSLGAISVPVYPTSARHKSDTSSSIRPAGFVSSRTPSS